MPVLTLSDITIAQINFIQGDIHHNIDRILKSIETAKQQGSKLVIFSELAISGYSPKDLLMVPAFVKTCIDANTHIITASKNITVVWGNIALNETGYGKELLNCCYIASNGELLGKAIKAHLPNFGIFGELRYFEPGPAETATPVFTTFDGYNIMLSVCADIWSHNGLPWELARTIIPHKYPDTLFESNKPYDAIINISASPYVFEKPKNRILMLTELAKNTGKLVLYANQVGANDDILFDGSSLGCMPNGDFVQLNSFNESTTQLGQLPVETHYANIDIHKEEFDAIIMGVRTYFKKAGFSKTVIGISGGIDSAVVATLAAKALGAENVLGLLMPGPYSSSGSITDAQLLCKNLGILSRVYNINDLFKTSTYLLSATAKPLNDLAEENMQSRLRGLALMTIANRENRLALATSNKSELFMGYSTLYGDSCGALAPIGDLYKTQVYELANWINKNEAIIPTTIINKAPSAELRPNQTDEEHLGKYEVLDKILYALIEDRKIPAEITDYPIDKTTEIALKIKQSEYKRKQSPIIFKLSKLAYGVGWQYCI